jgi:hypothetical protein
MEKRHEIKAYGKFLIKPILFLYAKAKYVTATGVAIIAGTVYELDINVVFTNSTIKKEKRWLNFLVTNAAHNLV